LGTGNRVGGTMLMGIFRPFKRWMIPLFAALLGLVVGFLVTPSKMDYSYDRMIHLLQQLESGSYRVEGKFSKNNQIVATSTGYWSSGAFTYHIVSPISDGTEFAFEIYSTANRFYINSDEQWYQGSHPHRFMEELSPLPQPFEWQRELLQFTKRIEGSKDDNNQMTYEAYFEHLHGFQLGGYLLEEQRNTTLTLVHSEKRQIFITFNAEPLRPYHLSLFDFYPEQLTYSLTLSEVENAPLSIPPEALEGMQLD
jgi:hypothetical protein